MKQLLHVQCDMFSTKITMDLDSGFVADANTRHYVATQGTPEPEVVSAMHHILRPGDIAIDGGANIGYFSLLMEKMISPGGTVLAFEPGENNLGKLHTNISLNEVNRNTVRVSSAPLWDCVEPVTLHFSQDSGQHSLKAHDTFGSKDMRATTIDEQNVAPRLIKLDIEGAEYAALTAAIDTIADYAPYVICELNEVSLKRFDHTPDELRKFMWDVFGYDTFVLHKNLPVPCLLPAKTKLKTSYQNTNVLFATIDMVGAAWPVFNYA